MFIETLKIKNLAIQNIKYHNDRMNATRWQVFKIKKTLDLSDFVELCPSLERNTVYKCRIHYSKKILHQEIIPYTPPKINTLKVLSCNTIDYRYKYSDRGILDALYKKKYPCDDMLIVKNERITDTYFMNVALYDGNHWYTPKHPLLKGTQRAFLIKNQIISEKDIPISTIKNYSKIRLFNAMVDWNAAITILIKSNIIF